MLCEKHVDGLQHKGTMSTKRVFQKISKIQWSYVVVCGHATFVLLTPARTVTISDNKVFYITCHKDVT